jgi:acetoacetate decarboxylase
MGFVKTPEEVTHIQKTLSEPRFLSAELLTIQYLTRPEIIAHVLPPGLEPTDRPLAKVMMGQWGRSNVCHAFSGACFYVEARHGDHVGDYCLAMQMSSDAALIFGREVFGEPKKLAETTLTRSGNLIKGAVTRYGSPIISAEAIMETREGASEGGFVNFHYKFMPRSDGQGLEFNPVLVMATFDAKISHLETGKGTLSLANTALDPLGEIEIVKVLDATYVEADTYARCETLTEVDADAFLPYAYSKFDDYDVMNNEAEQPGGQLNFG